MLLLAQSENSLQSSTNPASGGFSNLGSPISSQEVVHRTRTGTPKHCRRKGGVSTSVPTAKATCFCRKTWIWRFAGMGVPHSLDGLFHGKSHLEMDENWGYPYCRKPPCLSKYVFDFQHVGSSAETIKTILWKLRKKWVQWNWNLSPWKFHLVIPFLSKLQYLSIPHHLSKRSFHGLPTRLTGVENPKETTEKKLLV